MQYPSETTARACRHRPIAMRALFALTVVVAVAVANAGRAADEPTPAAEEAEPHAVVPEGQEKLLADMLGMGSALPGNCQFSGGQARGRTVRAVYSCPSGEVIFELGHPSQTRNPITTTERFAITLASGSPPDDLAAFLATRIREREATFEWKWLGQKSERRLWPLLAPAAVIVVAIALVLWLRARVSARRARAR